MSENFVYDADAQQRVPLQVVHGGKTFNVAHTFASLTDDLLIEYEKRCDVRLSRAEKKETDGERGVSSNRKTFLAAVWLWDALAQSVEGYKIDDGANFKEKVNDKYKAPAVEEAILACRIDETLVMADEGELMPVGDEASSVIRLCSYFAGQEVITEHTLREPNADEMKRYQSLKSRSLVVQGTRLGRNETRIPASARALGKLYDEVQLTASGYAGRVPLHHKCAVIEHHMNAEQEVTVKN
jgi:hypothetical protein